MTLNTEQQAFLDELKSRVPPLRPNHCFDNCKSLIMADTSGRIEYVEGLIHHPDPSNKPHKHAWILLDGIIVDVTLRYSGLVGYEQQCVTRKVRN